MTISLLSCLHVCYINLVCIGQEDSINTLSRCRHRDLDLVHVKDVEHLCNKLRAAKYHFSDHELQEVQLSLANCQYRKGIEFNLRLKSTPEDPRPTQRKSVKHFADDMRRR